MEIDIFLTVLQTMLTATAVATGVYFMMRYLQRGGPVSSIKELQALRDEILHLRNSIAHPRENSDKDFLELRTQIDELRSVHAGISKDEHQELLKRLEERIESEASSNVLNNIKQKVFEDKAADLRDKMVEDQYLNTIERLREELYSLTKRGNLNLSIGIMITIVGLGLLGMFVISFNAPKQGVTDFLIEFLPRISLVLLIEVFAFFFLSLYKSSLSEIKYFQNEVTSMESKYLALKVAIESDDAKNITFVIEQLAKSERNFILEKGQTTVDVERSKLEQEATNDILSKVASIFGGKS